MPLKVIYILGIGKKTLTAFKKENPPEFGGSTDPFMAEDWIERLEKIYSIIEYPEEKKTLLTTYKLKGEADRW